jgi:hypothetical protein
VHLDDFSDLREQLAELLLGNAEIEVPYEYLV